MRSGCRRAACRGRRLAYELIDSQLPVVVAKRMQISPVQAQAVDETGRSLGARLLSSLELATPEVAVSGFGETFDEEYVREVQEAVREFAAHGNVVILGRGAGAILGRRPDVLRVFMYAPRDWRVERVHPPTYGLEQKAAASRGRSHRQGASRASARLVQRRDRLARDRRPCDRYRRALETDALGANS